MKFYLGSPEPSWLRRPEFTEVPLFLSHRRLARVKKLPRAVGPWALDSGGFSELSLHDKWVTTPEQYATAVQRYVTEIGNLEWASPQDWMVEPWMTEKTGLSVEEHQARTVDNYLELRQGWPDLPFIPVLQGWAISDYLRCVELYERRGVDLWGEDVVGVGSVCRRQSGEEAGHIFATLAGMGLKLHGFGVKKTGLLKYGQHLVSADSMAWSFRARRSAPLEGCTHRNCNYCPRFALNWREQLLRALV